MSDKRGSDFEQGEIKIWVDGELLAPGKTKFALHGRPGGNWREMPTAIHITTDPEDQTYKISPGDPGCWSEVVADMT